MITVEKLRTYQEFDGDIDGWARASKGKGDRSMLDTDWYLINELLTGLTIIETGLASSSFVREVEAKMRASTTDEATRAALRTLVKRQRQNDVA